MRRLELWLIGVGLAFVLFLGMSVLAASRPRVRSDQPARQAGEVAANLAEMRLRDYPQVVDLPHDTAAMRRLIEDDRDSYLPKQLDQLSVERWPVHQRDFIRIWIDPAPAVENWNPQFVGIAQAAIAEWTQTGVPLRFEFVAERSRADVIIDWASTLGGEVRGVCRTAAPRGWIRSAVVTVALSDQEGRPVSSGDVHAVSRHEFGHALGLQHVTDPESVMYPFADAYFISPRDIATLRLLYRLPAGTTVFR